MKKSKLLVVIGVVGSLLFGCAKHSKTEIKINPVNEKGQLKAYIGEQQKDKITFVNSVNVGNQYLFYYFYLGNVSMVPIYVSSVLQYTFDTELTFSFSKLSGQKIADSISESEEVINKKSFYLDIASSYDNEITSSASVEAGIFSAKVKASVSATIKNHEDKEVQWTNNWEEINSKAMSQTNEYLTQYSEGYTEEIEFSEDKGFKKGNYYRLAFYDSVSAYGVLAYNIENNSYSTTTDFLFSNQASSLRVIEESTANNFDYVKETNIEFDVNEAIKYAEDHKFELLQNVDVGSSAEFPYLIYNATDFNEKIKNNDEGNKYFRLVSDIDFNGNSVKPIDKFYGHLDGAGHTLKNIKIKIDSCDGLVPTESDAYYIGMFQYIYGSISNLNIENVEININNINKRVRVGILAGGVYYGNISNCSASGVIKASNTLTGYTIWGGGLVGYSEDSKISHCNANAAIEIKNLNIINSGGLIGRVCGSEISSSYAQGNIKLDGTNISSNDIYIDAGGLVGRVLKNEGTQQNSKITNCYSIGNVFVDSKSCRTYVGGLIGRIIECEVKYVYATGEVTAKNINSDAYSGGLIAVAEKTTINNAFAIGNVYAYGNYQGGETKNSYFGYIVASNNNSTWEKIFYNQSASFKDGKAGTETKLSDTCCSGVSTSYLQSELFQKEVLQLDTTIWRINNGKYPTII